MEAKGKAWMAASAGMLALAILTAAGPVISGAFGGKPQTEPYGTIPTTGTCSDKLNVFLNSQGNSNTIFLKNVRDYFETQTGCVVEQTPGGWTGSGLYATQNFPRITDFDYAILNAEPYRVGGSFGSIPAWKVRVRYEIEIEALPDWGLCRPANLSNSIFSADWIDPEWPADDAVRWMKSKYGQWWFDEYWLPNYGKDSQYWSRYSVSFEKDLTVTDQSGPIVEAGIHICGYDRIFQNSQNSGEHYLLATYYLDPADLKPFNIPFYSWMGW